MVDAHEHGLVYRGGEASMIGGSFGATAMTVAFGSSSSGYASTTPIASGSDSPLLEVSDDDKLYCLGVSIVDTT